MLEDIYSRCPNFMSCDMEKSMINQPNNSTIFLKLVKPFLMEINCNYSVLYMLHMKTDFRKPYKTKNF